MAEDAGEDGPSDAGKKGKLVKCLHLGPNYHELYDYLVNAITEGGAEIKTITALSSSALACCLEPIVVRPGVLRLPWPDGAVRSPCHTGP